MWMRTCAYPCGSAPTSTLQGADIRGCQIEGLKVNAETVKGVIIEPAEAVCLMHPLQVKVIRGLKTAATVLAVYEYAHECLYKDKRITTTTKTAHESEAESTQWCTNRSTFFSGQDICARVAWSAQRNLR